jgi:hypothetical protein
LPEMDFTSSPQILETTLLDIEDRLRNSATHVAHSTKHLEGIRRKPENSVSCLAMTIRQCSAMDATVGKSAFQQKRLTQKKAAQERALSTLRRLTKSGSVVSFAPTFFDIDGSLVYDRSRWLTEAHKFGSQRFSDPIFNPIEQQRIRLSSFRSAAINDRLDGFPGIDLEFWDFLQARAKLKPGSGVGGDGLPPEVYLELPALTVMHIFSLSRKHFHFLDSESSSPYWKMLEFIGIPKVREARTFEDLRWICKSSVLQKWYMHSIRSLLKQSLRASWVHSYGFKRHSDTAYVCSLVRQLVYIAKVWNLPLLVSCQDVHRTL